MPVPKTKLCTPNFTDNERRLLSIVRENDGMVRSDLTERTDLAQQSIHRILEDLTDRGWLVMGETVRRGRGKPSPRVHINRSAAHAFGVSINTDSVVVCLVDLSCHALEEVRLRVPPLSRSATQAAVRDAMARMRVRNDVPPEGVIGLGVGISGYFVHDGTQVNAPEPMRDWSLIDIVPELEEGTGLPVRLMNNGTTAAIGELIQGVGRRMRSFGYLSFNYGFGGGAVINGVPLMGVHGNATELSAMFAPDEADDRPTLRLLIEMLAARGVSVDSIEDLVMRFDRNWPGVEECIERVLPQLDRAINTLAAVLDPQAIVFGGQIPADLARLLIERATFWQQNRYGVGLDRPALQPSEVAVEPSAFGAAAAIMAEGFFEP